jgi:hypothetical protein
MHQPLFKRHLDTVARWSSHSAAAYIAGFKRLSSLDSRCASTTTARVTRQVEPARITVSAMNSLAGLVLTTFGPSQRRVPAGRSTYRLAA